MRIEYFKHIVMFRGLKDNLINTFSKIKSKGFLTESDVKAAMREVRIALLEADVALPVVKDFIAKVQEKAVGEKVLKSISPAQMVIKIVNDELVELFGAQNSAISFRPKLTVVMMVGLQGSGKTTSSAKLALNLRKTHDKKVLLASLDVYRPAAQKQLELLSKQVGIDSLEIVDGQQPVDIAKRAYNESLKDDYDILILDTAGRLHTDQQLMDELQAVKKTTSPAEVLLVADSLTGQDAVNIAKEFDDQVGLTGIILTRVDGDARGGAALSMRAVTGQPIKFIGVGEKLNEFELFHPERAASRILDKGDVLTLVEHASEVISEDEAQSLASKIEKGRFNMDDLLKQLRNMKKLGGAGKMISMIPGLGGIKKKLEEANMDDSVLARQEAIISSMTLKERRDPSIIDASRRRRIAAGSGTQVSDINQLLNRFKQMQKMFKQFKGMDEKKLKQLMK